MTVLYFLAHTRISIHWGIHWGKSYLYVAIVLIVLFICIFVQSDSDIQIFRVSPMANVKSDKGSWQTTVIRQVTPTIISI